MDAIAAVLGCDDAALRRGDTDAIDKATSLDPEDSQERLQYPEITSTLRTVLCS